MKRTLLGLTLCILAACQSDPEKEVSVVTSPDGHSFSHLPFFEEGVTDVTISFAWSTDYARQSGVNPFVPYVAAEAILSEGTATLSRQEVMEGFNDKNARGRVYATVDHVLGELTFPEEHTEFVASVATEVLTTPQYSEEWLDRVKNKLADTQQAANLRGDMLMWGAARLAVLGDTPLYNALSLPNAEQGRELTRDEVLAWHKSVFTNAPAAISVAGRITAEDAGVLVDRLLAGLPDGTTGDWVDDGLTIPAARIYVEQPDVEKTSFGMVGMLPDTRDGKDHLDLIALNSLSKAEGPLYNAVRDEMRAAYGVFAGAQNYDRGNRIMYIFAEVEAEKLGQVIQVVQKTYDDFRAGNYTDDLAQIRDELKENVEKRVEYVNVASQSMLQLQLDGLAPKEVMTLADKFADATEAEVLARMQEAFPKSEDMIIVAAGPDGSAWPDACVITELAQIDKCLTGSGS